MRTGLLALAVALLPCVAGAAGLGRITVLTAIGQPLNAEIELVAVTPQEMASLSARLALPDAYRQANLQYNTALTGARVTIEKRPNGQPYLKVATTRPVVEPFIDLVVELTWAAGRLSREYTALLDPPGIPPLPATPMIAAVPEAPAAPAPTPALPPAPVPQPPLAVEAAAPAAPVAATPVETTPSARPDRAAAPAPAPVVSSPIAAAPMAAAPMAAIPMASSNEYGPIERGETLGKIAGSVKSDDVTLEQMLVALYRTNPDAFIRSNLNLVRAGKILRVPDMAEVAAIARSDAVQEYRAHVADWNAYRQTVAERAGRVPAEKRVAASGKITPKVDEPAARGDPKDVVRLSKGEPVGAEAGKGKPRATADRIRVLEEEAIARERALAEANSRIAQLERTIKDMQKLAELRAAAPAPKAAEPAPVAKPAPAKPAPAKPEAVAVAKPAPAAPPAPKPEPAATPAPKPEVAAAPTPKPQPAAQPQPKPQPKPAPAPQRREPDLMDEILATASDPLFLGAGGAVVLGGLAFWMVRRRRAGAGRSDSPPIAPRLEMAAAAAAGAAAVTGDTTAAQSATTRQPASPVDEVDPLQEADVYLQYGRDGQAEEILKEALARNPGREDAQLKLLEVYAGRKDKDAFGKIAGDLNRKTGGAGANWLKAAAMGYMLDPSNRLYEAGKGAETATVIHPASTASDVDLDLGDAGLPRVSTDVMLDAGAVEAATVVLDTSILGPSDKAAERKAPPAAPLPDFTLEVPVAGPTGEADIVLEPPSPARADNLIDFQIDLPKAEEPVTAVSAPAAAAAPDAGLDFKIEGLDLDLRRDEPTTLQGGAPGGQKDGQWYDVQTKFDLAKAYQEMGDRDGAREILQEVIKEGDAEQKAQATKLLESLG